MMDLSDLDKLEKEIASEVEIINTVATDVKKEKEIYLRYRNIHKAYIDLIKTGNPEIKNEALKRAMFLQWIGSFEPSHLTGVSAFDSNSEGLELADFQFVYRYIDTLIELNQMDKEMTEMLSYYSNWEFVYEYENFKEFKNLHNFVFNTDQSVLYTQLIRQHEMRNRGQMGDYFLSVNP